MIPFRSYGSSGPTVIVIHGGPADVGGAAPIAHGLETSFRVIEPWQRGSGRGRLTVARHVEDLDEVVRLHSEAGPPSIVGTSWGAMLGLAYAAEHVRSVKSLVLVGCGTFDSDARQSLQNTLAERTTDRMREERERVERIISEPTERMMRLREIDLSKYHFDPIRPETDNVEVPPFDLQAHEETWADMLSLQERGAYPRLFGAITSPVLMLHGSYDPHPGRAIRAGLLPYLPQLEYHELARCGHEPWIERHGRAPFFEKLTRWLTDLPQ